MRIQPRPHTLAHALVLLLVVLLVAGCADSEDAGDQTSTAKRSADRAEPAPDDPEVGEQVDATLQIRLEGIGDKSKGAGIPVPKGIACDRSVPATCRGELECPSAESPEDELCVWLAGAEVREVLLEKPPEHLVCTQVYGGPETATVTGTLDGKPVDASFSRTNGCEISRFDIASPLWTGDVPEAGSGAGGPGTAGGACPADRERDPDAPVSSARDGEDGWIGDDSSCAQRDAIEPEEISDPPEAFEFD